ncbi:MAG: hypothetical protein OXU75_06330 [Deltaproteobacteria bacterium]|nr:hypothetical protein [Deltaproteobacteria bacterium]
MTRLILISMASILLFVVHAGNAQESDSAYDGQLFTGCAPLRVAVGFSMTNTDLALAEEALSKAAESRLRAARLFRTDSAQFLSVDLNVVGTAFSLRIGLNSWVGDMGFGRGGTVLMWGSGATGTHGGDPQYILGLVSRHLDEFVLKYLRVNEEPCKPG